MSFNLKVADFVFRIDANFPNVKELCKDYLTDEPEEAVFQVSPEDIQLEREKSVREAELEGLPVVNYSEGYLETIAVYRKIADYISYKKAAVFHGALIELHGEGYLFTAKSGTGKTTHIRNWMKQYPEVRIINGDKPILKVEGDQINAYGTPWCGKEGYQKNTWVPLKAVILLERDQTNHMERISPGQAIAKLLSQTHRPEDATGMYRALELVGDLCERVSLYRLGCNMEQESAVVAYEGMQEED